MISSLLKSIFGSRNDRLLKQYRATVIKINQLEQRIGSLSDDALREQTALFKQRVQQGETLDSLLPEAFAVVRVSQTIEQTVCSAQQPSVSQTVTQSFDEDAQPLVEQTIVQEIPAQEDENAGTPCTEIKQSVTQNIGSTIRQSIKQSLLFASLLAAQTNCLGLAQAEDLADFSLAQLLDTKVSSAAKYEQESRNAPAAVQVITAVEIAQHGWTSLAQALNSLPGLYSNNDRLYDYQGARGLAIAGDYNTRLLLLIDGQRNNDNVYGQALLGSEGWLDMSVIEQARCRAKLADKFMQRGFQRRVA